MAKNYILRPSYRGRIPQVLFGSAAAAAPFVPSVDPNWWKRFQYGGVNPSLVLDFANGLYWNGSSTGTDPSSFLNNGSVTPGLTTGLSLGNGSPVISAAGALLTAFQQPAYAFQCSTYGCPTSFSGAGGVIVDQAPNFIILADNGGSGESFSAGAHLGFGNISWNLGTICTLSTNASGRRGGAVSIGASLNSPASDATVVSSPTTIYFGSNNGAAQIVGGGYIQSLAMFSQILPNALIPWPAYTGTNGLWWFGNTNAGVDYGANLAYEWTQPITMVAAINLDTAPITGHDQVTGFIGLHLQAVFPFTGYEFYVDGNGCLHYRAQTSEGNGAAAYGSTNLADGLWHVVAVTWNGSGNASGIQCYVDGVPETMTIEFDNLATSGNTILASGQTFTLLNQPGGGGPLPGAMGFFRMYNTVKSQSFIQEFLPDKLLPPIDGTCVLAPALNEGGSNTTTADQSTSNLTGTLSSASVWLRG